jgi:hypothetical protein
MVKISRGKIYTNMHQADLSDVLNDISSSKYRDKIMRIRQKDISDKEKSKIKNNLDAFCGGLFANIKYSGNKTNRNYSDFISTKCIVLDIDHCDDIEQVYRLKPDVDTPEVRLMKEDFEDQTEWITSHIYAAFRSPSGDGIKIIYVMEDDINSPEDYRKIWQAIADRFARYFNMDVDPGTKDATRCCFMSYDPNIYIAENPQEVKISDLEDDLAEYDETSRTTIELKSDDQVGILLKMAKHIEIEHYKQFRDLCSAMSNVAVVLGVQHLKEFYTILYSNNQQNFSSQTRAALDLKNMDSYIRSFMQDHNRVPLQHISNTAFLQGYDIKQDIGKKGSKKESFFKISNQKHSIIRYMNKHYACAQHGKAVAIFPDLNKKKYVSIAGSTQSISLMDTNNFKMTKRDDVKAFLSNRVLYYLNCQGDIVSESYWNIWWNHPLRRNITAVACMPDAKTDRSVANVWTGFNVHPGRLDDVTSKEAESGKRICQPLIDFIYEVVCNNEKNIYDFVISWMADIIQNPTTNKPGVCLVLRSSQGAGKNTFALLLQDIIGILHSIAIHNKRDIVGDFNSAIIGKLLIVMNEAFYSQDKQTNETIKTLITEGIITVHPKFAEPYNTDCISRFLILSNNDHIVDMAFDDRRFVVLDLNESHARDLDYFSNIRECMKNGGKESLYAMLKNEVEYSRKDFDTSKIKTEAMMQQKKNSMDSIDNWIVSWISKGKLEWGEDDYSSYNLKFTSKNKIYQEDFYKSYLYFYRQRRYRYKPDDVSIIIRRLKERIGMKVYKTGDRSMVSVRYIIPSLNEICENHPIYAPPDWTPVDESADMDRLYIKESKQYIH